MSRSKAWMPLYIGDYLGDTGHLTCVEHGAYLLLIMQYWRSGPLPDDDADLARIVRLPLGDWLIMAQRIRSFFAAKNGRMRHQRIDVELERAENLRKKRSKSGRKGGRAKAQKALQSQQDDGICQDFASGLPEFCHVQSQSQSPSSSLRSEESEEGPVASLPPSPAVPARRQSLFDEFWAEYPRKVGKDAARKAYAKATQHTTEAELLLALRRQSWPVDRQFIPHPATWLNQGRWQDDPRAAAPELPLTGKGSGEEFSRLLREKYSGNLPP